MKLILLGKSRNGKKSFNLVSEDQLGYNITCKDKEGEVSFNNLTAIEWGLNGKRIYIVPKSFKDHFDFTRYDLVVISKAPKLEEDGFTHYLNENN
ncbi:hypothetical protein [Pedobacter gandavensis]|uniref:Uncharacterized protein n=1 Tax=Pedobacter gandavensis TaxID=2679963 RepID=A0ABR6EV56_9SPHI|nr:hypothetical protein [Pedobacter gandavensis]MBB2149150.1 hypothetical protein [Pedobacter gandavensis]